MNALSLDLTREEWLAARRLGIGGSDVGPITGNSKWRTPLDIYRDKLGLAPPEAENDAQKWGKLLEPVVRQEYADATGRGVLLPTSKSPLQHPKYPFMLANLDGFTACQRIFEAKTARFGEHWGEEGSDEVPPDYLLQVQHYMCVTGYPVADIAALITGSDFRIYTVEADPEIHEMLIEVEAQFWDRVQRQDPPEPIRISDALTLWGEGVSSKRMTATTEVEATAKRLRKIKADIALLEQDEKAAKFEIMRVMQRAEVLVDRAGMKLVTWKTRHSRDGSTSRAFMVK